MLGSYGVIINWLSASKNAQGRLTSHKHKPNENHIAQHEVSFRAFRVVFYLCFIVGKLLHMIKIFMISSGALFIGLFFTPYESSISPQSQANLPFNRYRDLVSITHKRRSNVKEQRNVCNGQLANFSDSVTKHNEPKLIIR